MFVKAAECRWKRKRISGPEMKKSVHCTDENGKLKSREDVCSGMIAFYMKMNNSSREDAVEFVEEHMTKMPAWK